MACKVGPSGNIYLAGTTNSDTGIATPGAHQTNFGGINDVFLAKFSTNGQRIWATYFGGWGEDLLWGEGGGLSTDGNENVFMAGQTNSITGIATPGAFQTTITGISGFLTKFDSSGVQLWGTYYSADVTTQFYGCSTDTYGNVYATGMTNSSTNIASPGAFQTTIGGQNDAFLVSFVH